MNSLITTLNALPDKNLSKESIARTLGAALEAADPFISVERNLDIASSFVRVGSKTFSLYPHSRIVIIGIGKASMAMCEAAEKQIGDRLFKGVAVCKHNPSDRKNIGCIEIIQGSHPVPDQRSVDAALQIQETVRGLTEHDIVVLLLSGGGSALACLPAAGISLQNMQKVISGLLKSGASINELNAVRKHLDLIKGGGLLKMAAPAQVAALVISDVVNNPLDVIASGPAVPDPSTFKDAQEILLKYLPPIEIPAVIMDRIVRGCAGEIPETLKPGDVEADRVNHTLIASNQSSAQAALIAALREGFDAEIITCELVGEARLAGEKLAELLKNRPQHQKPYLGIAGGETTVKVTGQGLGGRNLEVALGAVRKMSGLKNALLVTLATDGEDGPTDAAGAFVTGDALLKAQQKGLEPETFLKNNDAYHFFEAIDGLILTGPTGTNVNDLSFLFG